MSFKRMMIKKNVQINEIALKELMKNEAQAQAPEENKVAAS